MPVHKGVYICHMCVVFLIVLVFLSGMSVGFLSWYIFITSWMLIQITSYICIKFCGKIRKAVIETYLLIHVVLSDASVS